MRRLFVILIAVLAAVSQLPAQQAAADRLSRVRAALPDIDAAVSAFATRSHVPGIAYAVLVDGALVHTGTGGMRDVATKARVTVDTVFRIASMTKSFTALCILKLRELAGRATPSVERRAPPLKSHRPRRQASAQPGRTRADGDP